MDLLTFLCQEHILDPTSIVSFVGKDYSPLFFSTIKQKLKSSLPVVTIDSLDNEAEFKAHLEISFLGTRTLYWLSPDFLDNNPNLLPYITHYTGPNIVSFFTQKIKTDTNPNTIIIDIPSEITYTLYIEIFTALYPLHAKKSNILVKDIFKKYSSLSLDSSYLLMHYCILIGNKSDTFIPEWLTSIIHPEKSLFILSTYFFAKKGPAFFELWNSISDDYSELFWTTYWSEQLFKAHAFITLNNAQNYLQAKRMAYRLPFSFIQKDWKTITIQELRNAHHHLYTLDWNLKNGLSSNLELFYLQFFLNKFF